MQGIAGRLLIDITDPRFFIPENADVLGFIRRANPFAHSDVGTVVFDCARQIDGAQGYCPSVKSYAYVIAHTPSRQIVAIAYDRRLAVRLRPAARAEAIAGGNSLVSDIGTDWVGIDPWLSERRVAQPSTLEWIARAYADAVALEASLDETSLPLALRTQLMALAELEQLLSRDETPYWLFGGWAVDFHAGRVTREHADIDVAIWSQDRGRVASLLLDCAWVHQPEVGEDGYTCYERQGVRLDLAFLERDERGHVYTPLQNGRGEWPAGSFGTEVAQLSGIRAHVVGRESLITDKSTIRTDGETSAKDRADVASLRRRD